MRSARAIFDEAVGLPRERWGAFVSEAAGGDGALAAKVMELLEAHGGAGAFLADPTVMPASALAEGAGTVIGRYRLLQAIGEGGFGVVFMAEQQEPVRRRVALKIIKLGMDTRAVVARFEAERQALALMDHPHIARVLDAGATETGRPYFVMELVSGEAITAFCDSNHLTVRQRLELFVQVCAAVQHAHQKGVIHRDLKPGNILVGMRDGRPDVKVVDFGIAKATAQRLTERTLFTEHRAMLGTPEYMSPEQAAASLDIDTRTDVYSLGVLLYELLTGSTPFEARRLREAAYEEVQRIIREEEPAKPSTRLSGLRTPEGVAGRRGAEPESLARLVRGDLDWIVMKAIDKDRSCRYDAASTLCADVMRHLAGEAVLAAPPSAAYRVRKFVRRHRVGVVTALAVGVSLGAGLIGTATFAAREARQRAVAEQRAGETARVAEFQARMLRGLDAVGMGQRIKEAYRRQVRSFSERRMIGPFSDWRPITPAEVDAEVAAFEGRAAPVQGVDVARRVMDEDVLGRAASAARGEFGGQPAVLARVLESIGSAYLSLGMAEQARRVLEEAVGLRRTLADDDEGALGAALTELGEARRAAGDPRGAESDLREALGIRRRLAGGEHPEVARVLSLLSGAVADAGRVADAEALQTEALAIRRRALGEDDAATLTSVHNLAELLHQRGELDGAEALYRSALAARRRVLGETDLATAATMNGLGLLLRARGDPDGAEPLLRGALAAQRAALGEEHEDVVSTMGNLSLVLQDRDDMGGALQLCREALALQRRLSGDRHPHVALVLNNLAMLLSRRGEGREAAAHLREALDIARGAGAERETAMYLHHLAQVLLGEEDLAGAVRPAEESVAMYRVHADWDPGEFLHALQVLAFVRSKSGDGAGALSLAEEALAMRRATFKGRMLARELEQSAGDTDAIGRRDLAEPLLREALALARSDMDERGVARYLHHLPGMLVAPAGDEAEGLLLEALGLYRARPEWDPREHKHGAIVLSELYGATGRKAQAVAALKESLEAERRCVKPGTIGMCVALERVGYGLKRLGAAAEAAPIFLEAAKESRRMHPEGFVRTPEYLTEAGTFLADLGRWEEAEPPLREAITELRAHPEWPGMPLSTALHHLGDVYARTGRGPAAAEAYVEAVERYRATEEAQRSPVGVAGALAVVARKLLALGEYAKAEPLVRECIAIRDASMPESDPAAWQKHDARGMLGAALAGQGKFAEGEPLLLGAFEGMKDHPNARPDRKREGVERIVALYEGWEKAEPGKGYGAQAAPWRERLDALGAPQPPPGR